MNTLNLSFPLFTGMKMHRTLPRPVVSRPRAVLFVNDHALAGVCAWCADKAEADAWCRAEGLDATHTICPDCRVRLAREAEREDGQWVA